MASRISASASSRVSAATTHPGRSGTCTRRGVGPCSTMTRYRIRRISYFLKPRIRPRTAEDDDRDAGIARRPSHVASSSRNWDGRLPPARWCRGKAFDQFHHDLTIAFPTETRRCRTHRAALGSFLRATASGRWPGIARPRHEFAREANLRVSARPKPNAGHLPSVAGAERAPCDPIAEGAPE